MPKTADRAARARARWCALITSLLLAGTAASMAQAQTITALPDQTSAIRLSNRDVNHVICVGGEIEDVKFSAEKAIAVEKSGSDAWIKFLVKEIDDAGQVTRSYVTVPSEFFVSCNGAIYPLYAEPSDIPAQTVTLAPGKAQRAKANDDLLGPLVEEERAVSVTLAMLQDRIPASFSAVAPRLGLIDLAGLPGARITERRRVMIEGSGLSASEYRIDVPADTTLDERAFLDRTLGARIFAVSADRLALKAGEAARIIVVRREAGE
ncbi:MULTISPECIES: type-F conjugative transfer system secretin TraK [unclassified Novosphingobium]|uniref:type-F conjugative transfer system secretin TraK n=1 Tax=unclassified Novosphingobium TaxID=2644732 RepID=UPI000D3052D2|nr:MULTISPECIES: type-F conjugative transfer system secretin TraK [unclassified Novosphingobium]PTR12600.1 conjugal transfer pilus assembly protein TraK [Novosphingobium sp. GV055]PUB06384.1 conjugal transfer pilus assembly protein TraK [Novosphingobium sp. GV061]PUB22435.1 conjugal transfer pilus assembly protein TraK [Novosphingobium sp. GV079]PUB44460.1 conjugal transfer pilus assembly protein TraK [Novosphingobium sp. GV027]